MTSLEIFRANHSFKVHEVNIPAECYGRGFKFLILRDFIRLSPILMHEVLNTFTYTRELDFPFINTTVNFLDSDPFVITSRGETFHLEKRVDRPENFTAISSNFLQRTLTFIIRIFKIVFTLFFASTVTAIYIKVTVIASPVIIYGLSKPSLVNSTHIPSSHSVHRQPPLLKTALHPAQGDDQPSFPLDRHLPLPATEEQPPGPDLQGRGSVLADDSAVLRPLYLLPGHHHLHDLLTPSRED